MNPAILFLISSCLLNFAYSNLQAQSPFRLHHFQAEYFDISPDHTAIATGHPFGGIKVMDIATGKIIDELGGSLTGDDHYPVSKIMYSRDGNQLFRFGDDRSSFQELTVYDLKSYALVRQFKGKSGKTLLLSPDEKHVLIEDLAGIFTLFDFQKGTKIKSLKTIPELQNAVGTVLAPDGKHVVAYTQSGLIHFINLFTEAVETLEYPTWSSGAAIELTTLQFSPDGSCFFTLAEDEILIWNTAAKEVIRQQVVNRDIGFRISGSFVQWAPDGNQLILLVDPTDGYGERFMVIDALTGETLQLSAPLLDKMELSLGYPVNCRMAPDQRKVYFTIRGFSDIWMADFEETCAPAVTNNSDDNSFTASAFSANGHELFITNASGEIFHWDLYRGIYKGKFAVLDMPAISLSCSSDHSTLLVKCRKYDPDQNETFYYALEFDIPTRTERSRQPIADHPSNQGSPVIKSPDGKFILGLGFGPISLYDQQKDGSVVSFVSLKGSDTDFVVFTGDGRFDGTPEGIKSLLYARAGNRNVTVESYRKSHFTPHLLRNFVFPGQTKQPALPPGIAIEGPVNDSYKITLTNNKGGIGPVEIFINEKLLYEDARQLASAAPARIADQSQVTFTVPASKLLLQSGKNNTLRVVAYDKGNNVSHTETKPLSGAAQESTPALSGDRPNSRPHFWAIVAGVSDYANSQLNLRYSAKDAEAMATALQLAGSNLFGAANTHMVKLTSENPAGRQPTKINLHKALSEVEANAGAHDVVVLYLSGHGLSFKDPDDEFYFLTSDALTTDYKSSETRQGQSLSGKEIRQFLNSVKAEKQVLIMDACASGTFTDNLIAGRDLSEAVRRGIERMRNRTATFVISGNANDQKSYESTAFGQGILTHTLLQGIRGAGLREGQYVDISQLFQYARDQVELLAREVNIVQVPVIVSPGNQESFDIGLLTTAHDREQIPVNNPKPVFTKTILFQSGEYSDPKDISAAIDARLHEMSYLSPAPIVFVQTAYPDAYHIAGEYTLKGNTLTLSGRLIQNKIAKGALQFTGPVGNLAEELLAQITGLLNEK